MNEINISDDLKKVLTLKPEEIEKIFNDLSIEEISDLLKQIKEGDVND